jgi:hypothetical protein
MSKKIFNHEGHEGTRRGKSKSKLKLLRVPEPALSEAEGWPWWLMLLIFPASRILFFTCL